MARRTQLVAGALVLALATVVAVVVAQYVVPDASTASNPQATSTLVPDPTTTSTSETRPSAPAVVPGWHTVVNDGRDLHYSGVELAYDVPAGWRVSTLGESLPVDDVSTGNDSLATGDRWRFDMSMLADHLASSCAASPTDAANATVRVTAPEMAGVGLVVQAHGPADGRVAAGETAQHMATFVYGPVGRHTAGPPTVTVDPPRQVTVHGVTGYQTTAHVTTDQPVRCGPTNGLIDVLALPGPGYGDSTIVVAFSDQQFSGAASRNVLDRIVTSFRQIPPP